MIEFVLRRDRRIVAVSLALVVLIAWAYLIILTVQTAGGDMSLMGMAIGQMAWQPGTFVLMFLMWWVMMIGMMVPSAAPMILLYGRVHRHNFPDIDPIRQTAVFAGAYLLVWGIFSAAATIIQWSLTRLQVVSMMEMTATRIVGGVLFVLAGLYQLSPWKGACLRHCRSPAEFLAIHWRPGGAGALRMGLAHGAYCVGCCWLIMALLFAGGVMNLVWVAVIALFVLLEKLLAGGIWLARAGGGLMLLTGTVLLL